MRTPEIVVPCRNAFPHEIPNNAAKLRELAEAHGWTVAVTYAKSQRPLGQRLMVAESIAVRMARETRLVGLWTNGAFSMGLRPMRGPGFTLRELKEAVTG